MPNPEVSANEATAPKISSQLVSLKRGRCSHVAVRKFSLSPLLAIVFAASAFAEWNTLGEIQELGVGITPGICTDPKGGIHIVTMADGGIVYRYADRSGRFGPPESMPVPEGPAIYNSPHLVGDSAGVVHVVFERDFTGRSKKAWYSNRQDGKWRAHVLALDLSATERRINYPRLAVHGTTVYVGAFAGGGSVIAKLVEVTSAPRLASSIETALWAAHPLIDPTGGIMVVGRAGPRGHRLERYSANLELRGEPLLLSAATPNKTGEPTAAVIDAGGVVHAVGVTRSTPTSEVIWYNTNARAAAGQPVIIGPEIGDHVKELTYPVLLEDAQRRIYLSYRHNGTGEAKLTIFDRAAGKFALPVTIAPRTTSRLRWNPHIAAAPAGGVYVVWEDEGKVRFRAVGDSRNRDRPNAP